MEKRFKNCRIKLQNKKAPALCGGFFIWKASLRRYNLLQPTGLTENGAERLVMCCTTYVAWCNKSTLRCYTACG